MQFSEVAIKSRVTFNSKLYQRRYTILFSNNNLRRLYVGLDLSAVKTIQLEKIQCFLVIQGNLCLYQYCVTFFKWTQPEPHICYFFYSKTNYAISDS